MAAREQAQQTREKKHGSNPGTFLPDYDEAQSADVSRARAEDTQGEQRQAREGRERRPEDMEQVQGEEARDEDEDEDESDAISQRP